MTYPVDQLTALAKANLNLALKLADVARAGGQESLQLGSKAVGGFAEEARSAMTVANGTAQGGDKSAADKNAALLSEFEKVREQMIAQTKAAFGEWQQAWSDAFTASGAKTGDTFAGLFKPWFAIPTGTPAATSATKAKTASGTSPAVKP